jgi:hypothetical protein
MDGLEDASVETGDWRMETAD